MNLAKLLATLPLAALAVSPAMAQEKRVVLLAQQMAEVEHGSREWFHDGFELVWAQVAVDMHRAEKTAQELWDAAQQAPTGTAATCAAVMEHVVTRLEGPVAGKVWGDRAESLPQPEDPLLAGYAAIARARSRCSVGDHVGELNLGLAAKALAERADDEVLRVRATMAALHGRPDGAIETFQTAFAEAARRGHAESVAFLQPMMWFEELQLKRAKQDRTGVEELMQRLDASAESDGNRFLRAALASFRTGLIFDGNNAGEAMRQYAETIELFREAGDRFDIATALDLEAWLAVRCDKLDEAKALVDQCRQLIAGRGMIENERELLQTRFELAVRMRDADTAAELSKELDKRSRDRVAEDRQMTQVRLQLKEAEDARKAAEAAAQEERADVERARAERAELYKHHTEEMAAADRRAWQLRWLAGLVAIGALAVVAGVALFGRRQMVKANAKLAQQVRAVQEAQAAHRELEGRLRQLERTESLGTMAAGIAHDFNNLLTSILGGAELLQHQGDGAQRNDLAELILTAGRQGARLCKQLQAFAGGTSPEPASIDLIEVVRDMLGTLRVSAGDGVDVRLTIDSQSAVVTADRGQFEQMLLNLVQNSKEAGAHSVRIRVAPRDGDVAGARIVVADDGRGMEPDIAQRIFDPFFTTKFPGRGLGLAVVQGCVRRQGGSVEVHSEPGTGTTFTISLPAAGRVEDVSPECEPAVWGDVPAGLVTLVVDDEPNVRQVLANFLTLIGCQGVAAESGSEALAMARGLPPGRPSVAFVDLTMPGVDGIDVVKQLRREGLVRHIVMMSGHAGGELARVASEAGCDAWLHKPFLLADVRTVLSSLLAGQATAADGERRPRTPQA